MNTIMSCKTNNFLIATAETILGPKPIIFVFYKTYSINLYTNERKTPDSYGSRLAAIYLVA